MRNRGKPRYARHLFELVECAWMEKNRRRWKNCERMLNTGLQFIHRVFLALLVTRPQTRSKREGFLNWHV